MEIPDPKKAKHYLARINYYRLSAYWYPFRQTTTVSDPTSGKNKVIITDEYKTGTKFPEALKLYVFDKRLRILVLDALERIEVALRADISIVLGQRDPFAHRDIDQLHGHFSRRRKSPQTLTKHEKWLEKLDSNASRSHEDFAKHFRAKYPQADMPIWIASELWDFGLLSHLYSGLLMKDRDQIAAGYGVPSGDVFASWIRCLNDVRNICAHHSRLWNKPLVNQPKWPAVGSVPLIDHTAGDTRARTRCYSALLIIQFMLRTVNPTSSWTQRLIKHSNTFPLSPYIALKNAGFPDKWHNENIWI